MVNTVAAQQESPGFSAYQSESFCEQFTSSTWVPGFPVGTTSFFPQPKDMQVRVNGDCNC